MAGNKVKQIELVSGDGLAIRRSYVYDPEVNETAARVVSELANTEANHLGKALPKGLVRLYAPDPEGVDTFVASTRIDHTPHGEKLTLLIGNAFDIVGERKQTDFKSDVERKQVVESFEITIRNSKKEEVAVRIKEPMYRWNQWKITQTNTKDHQKLDAFNEVWDVKVPPMKDDKQGEFKLTYAVEYMW
ncbi:MAG: hypothetical protein ACE15C_20235 [Phycisphaerae bacterium]